MSRYHSYINTAIKILGSYHGEMPFSIFIKQFFAKEKKYGSKDRKQIASLCYTWFRLGSAFNKQLSADNLLRGFFLITEESTPLINDLKPEWTGHINKTFEEKSALLNLSIAVSDIFPFAGELNQQTDIDSICASFLQQPDLFIRIRPEHKSDLIEKIRTAGVSYSLLNNDNSARFPAGTNIEAVIDIDKEAVVQDYNSQQVLNYIKENDTIHGLKEIRAWDCCAASGGKSILLYDLLNGKVKLTVSDIRQSIIANLQQRFKRAGIKNYHSFIADISAGKKDIPSTGYDVIICDVPCTGSGTWNRTPEQLYYFDPATIDEFSEKQKQIAATVVPYLNNNGLFFYITCSVFEKENENVAEHINHQKGMQLLEMKNLFGYGIKADSMFVAVFKKISDQ